MEEMLCDTCGGGLNPDDPDTLHLATGRDVLGRRGHKNLRFVPLWNFCTWECLVEHVDDNTVLGPMARAVNRSTPALPPALKVLESPSASS